MWVTLTHRYVHMVAAAWTICILAACDKPGNVTVRNELQKTVMQNVYWGDIYVGGNLYPGEETESLKVKNSQEKLPASNRVFFTVEGNGEAVAYKTWGVYELEEGAELKIIITDSTLLVEDE